MRSLQPFTILVPAKPPRIGKSRLGGAHAARRTELAAAFAKDTLEAASGVDLAGRVMLVTDDVRLAAHARGLGCEVLPDGAGGDLNANLVQAAHEAVRRWPGDGIAAVCADLPALRNDDLAAVLRQVPESGAAFVSDRAGTGTTCYAARSIAAFRPSFGDGSADRHRAAGAAEIPGELDSLRQDVDDEVDLERAMRLGLGPHTRALTAESSRTPAP